MLRIDIDNSANTLSIRFEGRFTGDEAENTRMLMTRCREGMRLIVDLTEVTFIDAVGEEVLSFFGRFGAEFVAKTSYTLDTCERLHLHLRREWDANTSSTSRPNIGRRRGHKRQTENEKV